TSESPLQNVDKSKIFIYEDSVSRRNFQLQQDSTNKNRYHIRYNWRPKKDYELVIEEGAMQTFFDDVNIESKTRFTLDEAENYGNIHFTVNGLDSTMNYIVELIDESNERIFDRREHEAVNTKMKYPNDLGGRHPLRIIFHEDKNGRWNPPDVYAKKQAESIW